MNTHVHTHIHTCSSSQHVYSSLTCIKFKLYQTFWNVTTVLVREYLYFNVILKHNYQCVIKVSVLKGWPLHSCVYCYLLRTLYTKGDRSTTRHDIKPTDACRCMRVYYTHRTPPARFGHSCGQNM